eukprot:SAG31_NODE_5047_length_2778_cov_3.375887_3_plen_168_part_00
MVSRVAFHELALFCNQLLGVFIFPHFEAQIESDLKDSRATEVEEVLRILKMNGPSELREGTGPLMTACEGDLGIHKLSRSRSMAVSDEIFLYFFNLLSLIEHKHVHGKFRIVVKTLNRGSLVRASHHDDYHAKFGIVVNTINRGSLARARRWAVNKPAIEASQQTLR